MINVHVDIGDIYHKLHRLFNAKLDYEKYLDYVEERFGKIDRALAYGSQRDNEASGFITCLKSIGFEVKFKRPRIFRIGDREIKQCNWGVDIAIDALNGMDSGDAVVLGVSSTDFIPLIVALKKRGIRVIIFASDVPSVLCKLAHEVIEITPPLFEEENDD